jgi:hypothetical protein
MILEPKDLDKQDPKTKKIEPSIYKGLEAIRCRAENPADRKPA